MTVTELVTVTRLGEGNRLVTVARFLTVTGHPDGFRLTQLVLSITRATTRLSTHPMNQGGCIRHQENPILNDSLRNQVVDNDIKTVLLWNCILLGQ